MSQVLSIVYGGKEKTEENDATRTAFATGIECSTSNTTVFGGSLDSTCCRRSDQKIMVSYYVK